MSDNGVLGWKAYLEPAPVRDDDDAPLDPISGSYFLMRTVVGILGLALPGVLLLGDWVFLGAEYDTRGSLSAYYHSGMRDVFVGILAVVGILLVTYRITERDRDSLYSSIAGIAAIGVAIFPTGIPDNVEARLTPLQERLGEGPTQFIHFTFAGFFVGTLGILCYVFAKEERRKRRDRAAVGSHRSPAFWYTFHLAAAIAIGCAAAFIVVTQSLGVFDKHSILIGEIVVTVAFGLSWLLKGWNRDVFAKMTTSTV